MRDLFGLLTILIGLIGMLYILLNSIDPVPTKLEVIAPAVTNYFQTDNWILDSVEGGMAAERHYIISTDKGSFKVVLDKEEKKVIKAIKNWCANQKSKGW